MNSIITGASKGFGKAIAEKFAAAGYNLFICSRNEAELHQTSRELKARYPAIDVHAKPFDLSEKKGAQDFGSWVLERVSEACGSVDILVNNAGQFIPGDIAGEPEGTLEKMIGTNLYSAYHLTRVLLPKMIAQQSGHIFNICSIASLQAYANGGSYSISKFALAGFSRNLREEMKPHGIKVTAVYPGAAFTDSWSGSGVDPLRIMEASDIAEMIYAASSLSSRATVEDIVMRPQLGDL